MGQRQFIHFFIDFSKKTKVVNLYNFPIIEQNSTCIPAIDAWNFCKKSWPVCLLDKLLEKAELLYDHFAKANFFLVKCFPKFLILINKNLKL